MLQGLFTATDLPELDGFTGLHREDYERILADCKADLQTALQRRQLGDIDVAALPLSDPLIKIVEVMAYREMLVRQRINESVQSCGLNSRKDVDLRNLYRIFTGSPPAQGETGLAESILHHSREIHTAGTVDAYNYQVHQALRLATGDDEVLVDVMVRNSDEACVDVTVLFAANTGVNQRHDGIDIIHEHLHSEEIRPIGQKLRVQEAYIKRYQIVAEIGLDDVPGATQLLEQARSRVREYIDGRYRLGKDIYRSGILSALHQPGVRYIILQNLTNYVGNGDLKVMQHEAGFCERMDVRIHVGLPTEMVNSAWVESLHKRMGRLSFMLYITPPEHEIRLRSYSVYWSDSHGRKLAGYLAIASLQSGGELVRQFSELEVPEAACGLVIHTVNQNGEMENGYTVSIPASVLHDE